MRPAIRVDKLSKCYRVGDRKRTGRNLSETVAAGARAAWDKVRRLADPYASQAGTHEFWALKDVSFEIPEGEVVGIIGRNGAGKSTLLKILSRIVEPTSGQAEIHGRVGSLLEVGTGFHPELTGRENVYLNGTILGMSRKEIDRKFDAIVDFAGVEEFLDTPVKRYSSGMGVRLGFAVAAHLEPDILIVDEVLAVGDAAFQAKCIDRMKELRHGGRSILFVSHQLGTIAALCDTAIRIEKGQVVGYGPAREQAGLYMEGLASRMDMPLLERTDRHGNGIARFSRVQILNAQGTAPVDSIMTGGGVTIRAEYRGKRTLDRPFMCMAIYNDIGNPVTYMDVGLSGDDVASAPENGAFICRIPELPLAVGRYQINLCLIEAGVEVDHIPGAAMLEIEPGPFFPSGRVPPSSFGYFLCRHSWSVDVAQ